MTCKDCPIVLFTRNLDDAQIPTRGTDYSVGMDITAIRVEKIISKNTVRYDTGISVQPPSGYYIELFPRSSLSSRGYVMGNSVGIIDPDYRGNLMIPLTKVDPNLPDIELPFKLGQLVLKKAEYFSMCEVNALSHTERGQGAFGSTDIQQNCS